MIAQCAICDRHRVGGRVARSSYALGASVLRDSDVGAGAWCRQENQGLGSVSRGVIWERP